MPKARLYFDGDNTGIEKESRTYSLTQSVEDKIDSISTIESTLQGEIDDLQDQINHVASRGRYLTTWNCVTGLPDTNPTTDPYVYRAGDYYIVSTIGGTNYRPSGSEYHINVASQAIEPQTVSVNDLYIYDGTHWTLQRTGASVFAVWGSITGNLQAQTDLQNALDTKANKTDVLEKTNTTSYTPTADYHPATKKYVDNNDTYIGTSAPTDNVVEGRLWYDTASDVLKVYNGSQWVPTGKTYTAGNHINISSADVISTTGLQDELTAGDNVAIEDICTTESDMKGPCPSGFHVPLKNEWSGLKTITDGLGLDGDGWRTKLKMPFAGYRYSSGAIYWQGSHGRYWASTTYDGNAQVANITTSSIGLNSSDFRCCANSIRPFKNTFVIPTSDWRIIQGTLGSAGIFWDQTNGLISITSDGATGYTIADKNLGAETVYNDGEILSEANCGKYYQWGNSHGFPYGGSIATSSTQVDASGYGPGNYYDGSTFITGGDWSSVQNDNLRGGQTHSTWQDCDLVISAIDTTYTASDFDIKDLTDSTSLRTAWDGKLGVSTDAGNLLSAGDKLWLGSTADFSSIVSPDANTMYIQYVSDSPTPPSPGWQPGANTLVYYNINDNDTNTTIYDLSGNGVDQTWYNTASYNTDATYGRVATFNGSNYTQGGSIINFGNACTVITLVKFSSNTSGQTLLNQGQGSGRWSWGINYGVTTHQSTNMACCFSGTSNWEDRTVETTGFTPTAGQWIMIAGTRASDNTAKIYINGVLNNTASNLSSPDYSAGSNFGFGQRGNQGNLRFNGDMKLVIGEDRTWTDKEIADLATEYGFNPS